MAPKAAQLPLPCAVREELADAVRARLKFDGQAEGVLLEIKSPGF